MICLQEYDQEFKHIHTIKGHDLCQLATKVRDDRKMIFQDGNKKYNLEKIPPKGSIATWYSNIWQYLKHGTLPAHLSNKKEREIFLKALSYQLIHGVIFRKHHNGVLLRCLEPRDTKWLLKYLHDGPIGGHFISDTNFHKVMRASYYWLTLFKDAHTYAFKCPICQRCARRDQKSSTPLLPIVAEEPFQQWGLDVIGEIFWHSSKQHRYILTATNYFTQWEEVVPLRQINDQEYIQFVN